MLVLCQGEVSTLLPLSFSHGADAFVIPDAAMVKIATFHTILQSWPADDGCVGYGSVSSFFCPRWLSCTLSFLVSVLFPVCSRFVVSCSFARSLATGLSFIRLAVRRVHMPPRSPYSHGCVDRLSQLSREMCPFPGRLSRLSVKKGFVYYNRTELYTIPISMCHA